MLMSELYRSYYHNWFHYNHAWWIAETPGVIYTPMLPLWIFTHLKLCLADAIHNFKWVKILVSVKSRDCIVLNVSEKQGIVCFVDKNCDLPKIEMNRALGHLCAHIG